MKMVMQTVQTDQTTPLESFQYLERMTASLISLYVLVFACILK